MELVFNKCLLDKRVGYGRHYAPQKHTETQVYPVAG